MNQRKQLIIILITLLLVGTGLFLTARAIDRKRASSITTKIKITASFYPMAEFARQIGGDRVDVATMVSPGIEPHDYDPTPADLTGLYKSRLFVYNGAGFERWVDRIKPELQAQHVAVVDASADVPTRPLETGEGHDARPLDPHVWLDPVLASRQVDAILSALTAVDPDNASHYHERADSYKRQLAALDQSYRTGLAKCQRRDIVSSHQAFGYLSARYNFTVLSIAGLSPDDEPTPQQLANVSAFVRQHELKYIFFEELVSPKLSQTLAAETGAETLVFSPVEGVSADDSAQGRDYLSIQQDNIKNLKIALNCN